MIPERIVAPRRVDCRVPDIVVATHACSQCGEVCTIASMAQQLIEKFKTPVWCGQCHRASPESREPHVMMLLPPDELLAAARSRRRHNATLN